MKNHYIFQKLLCGLPCLVKVILEISEDRGYRAITLNSERYRDKLSTFLVPELQTFEGFNLETRFEQDGAS